MTHRFDVVIAGSGPCGLALAVAAARGGYRTALIGPHPSLATTGRQFALSTSSRRILTGLGTWPMLIDRATPIRHIRVSERGNLGSVRLHAEQAGVAALGYVVREEVLLGSLYSQVRASRIEWLSGRVARLTPRRETLQVAVDEPGAPEWCVATKLLVGADGLGSGVRQLAGMETRRRDFGRDALCADVRGSEDHANWAFERFTDQGPIALLPSGRQGNAWSLVWSREPGPTAADVPLHPDTLATELQHAFGWRVGQILEVTDPVEFPLRQISTIDPVGYRVLLIGSAANSLHPVAGQGLNLGLRDVAVLADLLTEGAVASVDPGIAIPARFTQLRRADWRNTSRLTGLLPRLFAIDRPAMRTARAVGLAGFDLCAGAKRRFARRAMGLDNPITPLERGGSA